MEFGMSNTYNSKQLGFVTSTQLNVSESSEYQLTDPANTLNKNLLTGEENNFSTQSESTMSLLHLLDIINLKDSKKLSSASTISIWA